MKCLGVNTTGYKHRCKASKENKQDLLISDKLKCISIDLPLVCFQSINQSLSQSNNNRYLKFGTTIVAGVMAQW